MSLGKTTGMVEEAAEGFSVRGARAQNLAQHLVERLANQFGFGDTQSFSLALECAVLLFGDVELLTDHAAVVHHIQYTDRKSTTARP